MVTYLDCDLNVPTMPCPTRYDGTIADIASYLMTNRPVGWVEEYSKLQPMERAAAKPTQENKKDWLVKFRHISPGVVLPRQVRVDRVA